MSTEPDHPDDVAERWCERFDACDTQGEVHAALESAKLAGVDIRLCRKLWKKRLAEVNALEALREATV